MTRLVLAVLGLAACGGGHTDIASTLVFADRTDAEIARLISAAGGTDMFGAQTSVDRFADEPDPCPAVAIAGNQVTLTGGCTTLDDVQIEGSATVTNATAWDAIDYQFGNDTVYELAGWTLTQSTFVQQFDGMVRIDSFTVWDADVTTTQLGVAVRSDLYYDCNTSRCDLDGSGVELIGVGGARVSGSVQISNAGEANFTLRGKDTLTATVSQGCVAWQISGSDRKMVCQTP